MILNAADASPPDDTDELLSRGGGSNDTSSFNILTALIPPSAVIQSFLWPLHNCLLATWIEIILVHAILTGAMDCCSTVLFGYKTTGKTLSYVWNQHIRLATIQSIYTITDYHQPITARCIGLLLWPAHILVQLISIITIDTDDTSSYNNVNTAAPAYAANGTTTTTNTNLNANIWTCLFYTTAIFMTGWYWLLVVPYITFVGLLLAFWVGGTCFGLIELAGV